MAISRHLIKLGAESGLQPRLSLTCRCAFASKPAPREEARPEDEEPPGAFATIGLMGFGALGAVGVAALGVLAVFQIANFVAAGTGRSIMAGKDEELSVKKEGQEPPKT